MGEPDMTDLFGFRQPEPPRARKHDPATSKAAAFRSLAFSGSHAERVLSALKSHGPRTAHEIGLMIGLTVVQIDRRLPELEKQGRAKLARYDDGKVKERGGCRVWEAT